MVVTFFFRKPRQTAHSIEELFVNIQKFLPKDVVCRNVYMPFNSTGFFARFLNIIYAFFHQSEINHITGDINYISFLLTKQKTILTFHDIEILYRKRGIQKTILELLWFKIPFKRVVHTTVISEFTKTELVNYFKFDEKKISVISNCFSPSILPTEKVFNKEKPVILQIGTKENKNIPRLVEALKNIPCKLIIIGKLSDLQRQKLESFKIDYENYFNLEYSEIINHYNKCDIVSFVSTYEGFGLPILEGNAAGRVVITANIGSMCLVSGNASMLVNPHSTEDIKNGITEIINNDYLRDNLIKNGFENIQRFHPQIIALEYFNLYKKVIERRNL